MVSIGFREERHNVLVGVLMIVLSLLFLFFMGRSMVHSTHSFWKSSAIERVLD